MQFLSKRMHWVIALLAFAYVVKQMRTFVLDRLDGSADDPAD